MLIILKANGDEFRFDRNDKVKLEEIQELVDGYVEIVPYFNKYLGQPCVALCNEVGKLKHYPENKQATEAWYNCLSIDIDDILVGDIVVLTGSAMKGWI